MVQLQEPVKGIGVFVILSLLVYFAYDNIISGILNWAITENSLLGSMGWVTFVLLFLISAPGYMLYTFFAGSNNVSTRPGFILAGFSAFFLFLIIATAMTMVFSGTGGADGLITSLNDSTSGIHGEDWSDLNSISYLALLIFVLGCFLAPLGLILYGYGQLDDLQGLFGGNKNE